MSEEIQAIVQYGTLMYRIGKGVTLTAIKVFHNIYYGQWYGKASFQKLHKIAGSHISYLEVQSQDPKVLKQVQAQIFDKYKVLYSPLPDLNGADGVVQYAFHADQTEALRAGLNQYNIEKLQRLSEAKERYGVGTQAYVQAKTKIEAEFPTVRSITCDDYVMTRLSENGQETTEYKELARSAKEEIAKAEVKVPEEAAAANVSTEEKVIQFQDHKKRIEYEDLIKQGKARRLAVAELRTEYVPIAGEKVPYYHAQISDTESVVLPPSAKVDEKSAVLIFDRKYPVVSTTGSTISKKSGQEVSEKIAKRYSQMIAEKAAKESVKTAAKSAAKVAARSNPYTAAAEVVKEATVGTIQRATEVSTGGRKR